MLLDALSWIFLLIGSFLCLSGGVGIVRFPDFYSRMHAVGVTDTLAAGMIFLGLMLQAGLGMALVKLILVLVFIVFVSPTASHALAKAAMHAGLAPKADGRDLS